MKRLILLAMSTALVALVMGCGESSEKQAASRIEEQASLAQRYFRHAVGLMTDRQVSDAPQGRLEVAAVNPEALRMLDKAAGVAKAALTANPGATAIGKVPAHRILVEIYRQKGLYYTQAAAVHAETVERLCHRAELRAYGVADLGHLGEFYRKLASLDAAQVEQMRRSAQQDQQAAQAQRQQLQASQQQLEGQVEQLLKELEPLGPRGRQLRQQAQRTPGREALPILTQAEQIERQADLLEARTNDLKVQLEQVADQAVLTDVAVRGAADRIAALDLCLKDIANRGQIVAQQQQELAVSVAKATQDVAGLTREVAAALRAAAEQYERGLEAYDQARQSNRSVQSGVSELASKSSKAGAARRSAAGGPTLLESMSDRSRQLPALACEGELALAAAEAGRRLLELAGRVQALQARLADATATAGIPLGNELVEAVAAVPELPGKIERTKADYEAAGEKFGSAAELAGRDKDVKQSAWIYQVQKAKALLGLYLLSRQQGQADSGYLTSARKEVDDILAALQNENRVLTVDMAPVAEMDRMLRQMQ